MSKRVVEKKLPPKKIQKKTGKNSNAKHVTNSRAAFQAHRSPFLVMIEETVIEKNLGHRIHTEDTTGALSTKVRSLVGEVVDRQWSEGT